ncbi:MAG: NAD-dependent epimerase/dehydratase family protein [Thaumarchaeota archaeon]|nr:NAD-dependent epimerase/dehydratase family protein [Nitrososphaerota archaeon]
MASSTLVTGGDGFVGRHLVSRLIEENSKVVILDNFASGSLNRVVKGAEVIIGDIRDKKIVRKAVDQVDQIVHLAARINIPESIKDPKTTLSVNVDGTRNLLDEAKLSGVKGFVYASSCAVYGEAKYIPQDEKHPVAPISPYASSKLAAEGLCRDLSLTNGLNVTILRFFNIYGPGQKKGPYAGVIKNFLDKLRAARPIQIHGNGEQVRDFIFIEDVVDSILRGLTLSEKPQRILNIGSGRALSINQLASMCQTVAGTQEPIQHLDARPGDIERSCADTKLMRQVLTFSPRISIEEGLKRTLLDTSSPNLTNHSS